MPPPLVVVVYFLAGLGVVGRDGKPQQKAGIGASAGLYFVGLSMQWSFASATLRGVGADAKYVISRLARYLRMTPQLER